MSNASSSTLLAESLAALSKTAHQVIADVETRSRSEVARAIMEANEVKSHRDKILKDIHASQLEMQAWKQEANSSKAALGQAELTIAHQTDTLGHHAETISQLRREVSQWKDQSRNWQEHFLRVEQERCALSSRMDELVSERLHWSRTVASSSAFQITPQSRYIDSANSAPSSTTTKRASLPSPTHPSTAPISPTDLDGLAISPPRERGPAKVRRIAPAAKTPAARTKATHQPQQDLPSAELLSSGKSRPLNTSRQAKPLVRPQSPSVSKSSDNKATIRQSTVIRRVHAIVHVKREESDDESIEDPTNLPPPKFDLKDEGSVDVQVGRRRSRMIVEDDDEDWASDDDETRPRRRTVKAVNYLESADEDEDEEDELMMGAEDHHEEIFGTSKRVTSQNTRPKPAAVSTAPPKKRRKI